MEKEQEKYELSYLASPFLSEEKIYDEVTNLRKILESHQCLIIDEGAPSVRKLAYVLRIPRVGKFESAWFGWIRFVATPEKIDFIKGDIEKDAKIFRFLVVKLARELSKRQTRKHSGAGWSARKEIFKREEVREEEIDKKIEEMISA